MSKVAMEVVALQIGATNNHTYTVLLGEINGTRRIPIVIGEYEAQSIAMALEQIKASRPLTHDLMMDVLSGLKVKMTDAYIYKCETGIFYSYLYFKHHDLDMTFDSRTSDAISLAIRFDCPIYINELVLDSFGFDMDQLAEYNVEVDSNEDKTNSSIFSDLNIEDLEKLLQEALEEEDYNKAILIRDELNRKKKGK